MIVPSAAAKTWVPFGISTQAYEVKKSTPSWTPERYSRAAFGICVSSVVRQAPAIGIDSTIPIGLRGDIGVWAGAGVAVMPGIERACPTWRDVGSAMPLASIRESTEMP